jgi:hypothetical protein
VKPSATSEIRLAEPRERFGQIDQAAPRAGIENAMRSHHREPFCTRGGNAGAVVHQDCVGIERTGQGNSRSFAAIEP